MNTRSVFLFCFAILMLIPSCSKDETVAPVSSEAKVVVETKTVEVEKAGVESLTKPETLAQKFSYVYGFQQSQALLSNYDLDEEYIAKGVLDGATSAGYFSEEEMQSIMYEYITALKEESDAELAKIQSDNLKKAEDFLAINKTRSTVSTTSSGLQYEILREGSGKTPDASSVVNVQYQLTLLSGEVVDSSYSRGTASRLDLNSYLVSGFKEAVMLLKEGGKIRAWLHPTIGYGQYGSTYVQPNELLIFDIELISVE